ncbi:MAG: hypothetical protein H6507_12395 [Calditrichaeota bacterium]|nr:hypothetical protein [Calditrichota bacterium]
MTLILLVGGLGIVSEFPHHDDHEGEMHTEMGVTMDGHCHCQALGMTAHVEILGPALLTEFVTTNFTHRFPLPPLFPFERPPKSHLS